MSRMSRMSRGACDTGSSDTGDAVRAELAA